MDYSVVEKINIRKDRCEKIGAFLFDREKDAMYLDMPWPFPVQIGISEGLSKCEVTPMFLKIPFIMKGWINQDILLRQIELLRLVLNGKILMHASCVDGVLIVGFPNAGKTYETYRRVAQGGILISEEYTIIQKIGDTWHAAPYQPMMRTCFSARTMKDCGIKMSLREKLWLAVATLRAKLFPFMYEAVIWKKIPVSGKIAPITKILYGSTEIEIKDWHTFAILCENEFPFMSSEFLQAYAVAAGLPLLDIQRTQRQLIKEFVESIYASRNGKNVKHPHSLS